MDEREAESIRFARVHRIGQTKAGKPRSRPVVAKLTDSKMKFAVMGKGRELKGTNFSISDQFPPEIPRRRRLLYPIMTEARND
ncbi:hypothetical protein SKAU_G00056850 [Synaphobranchus kaupii]|uniref:Uncharacterized protein n=1 Tax=Synaphobranchus kaupii TaxID=118154 RepID=A0A9Q1JAC0_SYNKA|nr:hypothetical protein SKAU_G00056850 [Synaphobranchus kaupii]